MADELDNATGAPAARRPEAASVAGTAPLEGKMQEIRLRGTVTIDVEACKGCDLCIDACKPDVLVMTTTQTNTRGYRFPQLLPGCTGCRACADVCPDFCFQVFRFDEPKMWTSEGGVQ